MYSACTQLARGILAIGAALTLFCHPAFAAETSTFEMEEILVTGDIIKPAPVSTLEAKVVSPGKVTTLPDLLRNSAGIDVQLRSAYDNSDGAIKLRGYDARRYTVLINGRPAGMAGVMGGSYVDWLAIPLSSIEKVQITKGVKSAAHGNTLGGVINIVTKSGYNGGQIDLATGQNGRYQSSFQYGGSNNGFDWSLTYGKFGSDGYLRNNDYDAEQVGVSLSAPLSKTDRFTYSLNRTEARRGMIVANDPTKADYDPAYPVVKSADADRFTPAGGLWAVANPGSYWKKYTTRQDVGWIRELDNGLLRVNYWQNKEKRHDVNYQPSGSVWFDRSLVSDSSSGWQLSGETRNEGHRYIYGLEQSRLRYGYGGYDVLPGGVAADSLYPSQKVDVYSAYVEDTFSLSDKLLASVGLRYDEMRGDRDDEKATKVQPVDHSAVSPRFNLAWQNDAATTTRLSVNRLWRAPSMAEFYWWSQNYSDTTKIGSLRDLKPESGWEYDLGVNHRLTEKLNTGLTFYYQDINNYINFTHQSPFSCYNIDQATLWGFEWENEYRMSPASSLTLNYTYQRTKKQGTDPGDQLGLNRELDYRPRHKVGLTYLYDEPEWQFRYRVSYAGKQTANYLPAPPPPVAQATPVWLGGYVLHSASITKIFHKDTSLTLAVDNLFDKHYAQSYNYPQEGRVVSLHLSQKL